MTPAKFYAPPAASDSTCSNSPGPDAKMHSASHPLDLFNGHEIDETAAPREDMRAENDTEARAFEEDLRCMSSWPPRSYRCSFCLRIFTSAQALGGHMNIHRRDRARNFLAASNDLSNGSSSTSTSSENISFNEASTVSLQPNNTTECSYNCDAVLVSSSVSATTADTLSSSKAACAMLNDHAVCQAREKHTCLVNAIPSAKATLHEVSPLHKERCRFVIPCSKGRTRTSKYNLRKPICFRMQPSSSTSGLPAANMSAFNCKLANYDHTMSLLKDTSCNIIDLELRLGPKRP